MATPETLNLAIAAAHHIPPDTALKLAPTIIEHAVQADASIITGRIGDRSPLDGKVGSDQVEAESHSEASLDEPVSETILRDLRRVGVKLKHVLIPKDTVKELRNWDLWGPLLLCLILACTLGITAKPEQTATVFAAVFFIIWCGAAVVTLNAALLGGNISFFQSVCVLGYCLAPLVIAALGCRFWNNKLFQLLLVLAAFVWATRASVGFMAQLVPTDRRALGVFPVFLFYLSISWLILIQ